MSALFATATTGTSTGAVNTMHDSLTPLGGLVPMFNLLAGCIWPGGVGAGLYGFLVAGDDRRVHRRADGRPHARISRQEDRSARDEARDVRGADLPAGVLGFSAASVMLQTALDSLNNSGPHGLSEILYAYASANANNGSAFAGLNGNTPWFNTTLGIVMLLGRFAYVIPVLALAGGARRPRRRRRPRPARSRPPGRCSSACCIGVIVILYLLQYFPALALGPVVEHFLMLGGKTF